MNSRILRMFVGLSACAVISACIDDPPPAAGASNSENASNNQNATNNTNASNNANAANSSNVANNGVLDFTELELEIEPESCAEGEGAPILEVPAMVGPYVEGYLRSDSAVSVAPITERSLPEGADIAYGFGWAHREGNAVHATTGMIYAGAGQVGTTTPGGAKFEVSDDEDVLSVLYQPGTGLVLHKLEIFTTKSAYHCEFKEDAAASECIENTELTTEASGAGVYPVESVSFVPYMVEFNDGSMGFDLASFLGRVMFLGLGGTEQQHAMGVIRLDFGAGSAAELTISNADVRGPFFYGARMAYGYTTDAKGAPYLLTVTRAEADDSDARPSVFVANAIGPASVAYVERENDDASWFLHPEIAQSPELFSFTTSGSIIGGISGLSLRYDLSSSEAKFGYVGVVDGDTLVFAREEGFVTGDDFLVHEHATEIHELSSGAGMRFFSAQQNYDPIVAFVSGDDRDELNVFNWQSLGLDLVWFEGVTSDSDYVNIRDLEVPDYFDDQAFLYFRATGESNRQVLAIMPIINSHDLAASLCVQAP